MLKIIRPIAKCASLRSGCRPLMRLILQSECHVVSKCEQPSSCMARRSCSSVHDVFIHSVQGVCVANLRECSDCFNFKLPSSSYVYAMINSWLNKVMVIIKIINV